MGFVWLCLCCMFVSLWCMYTCACSRVSRCMRLDVCMCTSTSLRTCTCLNMCVLAPMCVRMFWECVCVFGYVCVSLDERMIVCVGCACGVCVCVMGVRACVWVHVCARVCVWVYVFGYISLCTCIMCLCICVSDCIDARARMYAWANAHVPAYMCVYAHTQKTPINSHTNIHRQTYIERHIHI